jgi:hypothetical protein
MPAMFESLERMYLRGAAKEEKETKCERVAGGWRFDGYW